MTKTLAADAMEELGAAMGLSAEAMAEFVANVDKAAQAMTADPKKELLWRPNAGRMGGGPGRPVNGRGLGGGPA